MRVRDRNASYETARRSAGADLHGPPELTAAGQRARQRLSMSAVRFGRRGGGLRAWGMVCYSDRHGDGPLPPKVDLNVRSIQLRSFTWASNASCSSLSLCSVCAVSASAL